MIKPQIYVTPPRFHRLRIALAIKMVGWSAALIVGVINGMRVDVA